MAYTVNGIDDSADGMERLRSHTEVILLAYPHKGDSPSFLEQSWLEDLDNCAAPDGFDYDAAIACIRNYCKLESAYLFGALESATEGRDDGETEPRPYRLYLDTK